MLVIKPLMVPTDIRIYFPTMEVNEDQNYLVLQNIFNIRKKLTPVWNDMTVT